MTWKGNASIAMLLVQLYQKYHLSLPMKATSCSRWPILLVLEVSATLILAVNSYHLKSYPFITFSKLFIRIASLCLHTPEKNLLNTLVVAIDRTELILKIACILMQSIANFASFYY